MMDHIVKDIQLLLHMPEECREYSLLNLIIVKN